MRFNKMNYIKQSIWAFAAIALVACSSDDDKDTTESLTPVENTSTSFSATIETGNSGSSKATRTSLVTDADVPYPVWSSGDQLYIYNATTPANALFDLKSDEYVGQRQGVFDGTITKNAGDKFFALYCSTLTGTGAPTLTASNGSATISATIPSALVNYTAGFHPEYHFMTGYTTENTFKLKNAMSLIKINLADNNYANFAIRKIHFKAINGDNIAGTFTASIGDDGTIGTPSITSGGSSEIIISNSDGSALATGVYYIPVLPATLTGGFTLTFENTEDGAIYERSNTKANYTIGKSEIINLGSFTAKACAKEAYVDLGLTNTSGQKVMWCVENVYDEGGESNNETISSTNETSPNSSYYAWGETYVKANQKKYNDNFRTYSWYFDYSIGQGSGNTNAETYRSYKHGLGSANYNAFSASESYEFLHQGWVLNYQGVLIKYNSSSDYIRSFADWRGGTIDDLTVLDTDDDAAYQKSPRHIVRMPSNDDCSKLFSAVTKGTLTATNETSYVKFENKTTHNYIKFPIGGFIHKKSSSDNNSPKNTTLAAYWTRDRATGTTDNYDDSYKAWSFLPVTRNSGKIDRCQGRMIRGVIYK